MSVHTPAATRLRPWSPQDGRWLVAVILPIYCGLFFGFRSRCDPIVVGHASGVAVMQPVCSDLYVIPSALAPRQRPASTPDLRFSRSS